MARGERSTGVGDVRLRTLLVAVVEDDQSVLEALADLLESAGHEVALYSSGEEFIAAGRLGDIDCLISDIGLPGISGIELLQVVRASRSDLPVIVITARHEPVLLKAATDAGASHLFLKPLNNKDLLDVIAAMQR
jgi:FixJ family two-component response regulator